jgi:hypothetical protein
MLIKRLTVISVKLTSSVIATAKDEKEALRIHNKNSRTHEKLLKQMKKSIHTGTHWKLKMET